MLRLQDRGSGSSRMASVHTAVGAGREGLEPDTEFAADEIRTRSSKSAGERFPKS